MSHHYTGPDFGFPRGDARLDLTDLFAFPKPGDAGKSIVIMDVHPSIGFNPPGPTTTEPFAEWMRWFWHGHFVSTLRVVKQPQLMVQQLRLFGTLGLGDFRSLLRAVTIDPAMLIYLDGTTSTKGAVNENYGREVLELFALGIGNYGEADVRAGAEALTGWRAPRRPTTSPATANASSGGRYWLSCGH